MRFKAYSDVQIYLKACQTWLEQEEAINNVVLGACSHLVTLPEDFAKPPLLLTLLLNSAL
jgi:hypothetical protein